MQINQNKQKNDYKLATPISRVFAFIIDTLILTFIHFLFDIFLGKFSVKLNDVFPIILFFLLLISDGFKGQSQSIGKRILKITTLDKNSGKPCSFYQSFLRKSSIFICGPFEFLGMARSAEFQRIGDRFANTIVVYKKI